jgi:DnaJ-class molecular chaperone
MKATLYEALGIPPAAPDEEVRAALRRLIRKYYAKPVMARETSKRRFASSITPAAY